MEWQRKKRALLRASVLILISCSLLNAQELQRRDFLPDKPTSLTIHAGQYIFPGQGIPAVWPEDLVMTPSKVDGVPAWKVESIHANCFFCEKPRTFKQAAFDRPMIAMYAARIGMATLDIELTHHAPCFRAGTCREGNPLIGNSRAQAYSLSAAYIGGEWMLNAWLRKGNKRDHEGGIRYWWVIPVVGYGASAFGIIHNLTMWNRGVRR